MPELTTEAALNILIGWLKENIDCGTEIIFEKTTTQQSCYPISQKHCRTFAIFVICNFCNRADRLTIEPYSHHAA